MPKNYIVIDLPPGVSSNGTEYSNAGRWVYASRVRWHNNNAVQPIGGWEVFQTMDGDLPPLISSPSTEICRAMLSWKDNTGISYYAAGTNLGLYAFRKTSSNVYNITPTDFTARLPSVVSSDGYGMGLFGRGAFGTPRPHDADNMKAFSWCFRTWGQNLLAAPRGAPGKLYEWDLNVANKAVAVANAPIDFDCFHVTDQRIVIAAGTTYDPRIVNWSTSENNTVWTPEITNQAGSMRLQGTGRFLEIVTVQDQYLFISETDAYVARYIGPPYIFSFDQVAVDCGALSGSSVVSTGDFAVWPSVNDFFMFDGSSVRRLPCSVSDQFKNDQNPSQTSKIVGFINPEWPEIWWLYQSNNSDELDSYIFYNWSTNYWSCGKLNRSAATGYYATGGLIMIDHTTGVVYSHEKQGVIPTDNDGSDVFVESGPIELTTGNTTQFVKTIQPDFNADGNVQVTIIGRDRPNGPETAFGPYNIDVDVNTNQPVPARARGHSVRVKINGKDEMWKLGKLRLDFKLGGEK